MNPSPQELKKYLVTRYPNGNYYTVYEAGFCGFWIDKELNRLGINNIVVNAADVPTTNKERQKKSDKIDSRKLAKKLENGDLEGIYVPSDFHLELRSLARQRNTLTKEQTRTKNRIKGHLYFYGKKTESESRYWSGKYIKELKEMEFNYKPGKLCLEQYLDELERIRKKTADIIKILRNSGKEYEYKWIIDLLTKTVPGIGFITAITLYTEIMDMRRFSTMEKLSSFVGLIPSTDSSGEKEHTKGITKRRNKYLRHLIIEAAWIAIRQDEALFQYYSQLTRRMKSQRAIVSVARKLLSRIRHVWLNNEEYVRALVA
jgi:transposase